MEGFERYLLIYSRALNEKLTHLKIPVILEHSYSSVFSTICNHSETNFSNLRN